MRVKGIYYIDCWSTSADESEIREASHVHDLRGGTEMCIKRCSLTGDPCPLDPLSASTKPTSGIDYKGLAEGIDRMREMLTAMRAGLMSDGYTEEQARVIITGVFALAISPEEEG